MDRRYLSDKFVEWYLQNKRNLPWRETKNAYHIWLSEIILQQTRVVQGLSYYLKFVQRFPTVRSLAEAKEQDVLRLWQGLGYYTRARNLHKCATIIHNNHRDQFPDDYAELLKLPGIGEYTAAAIASFAFGKAVAVVDGNVFRVLSRLFGIDKDISSPEGKKHFTHVANSIIGLTTPDLHNQAVMEFGAMHCTPQQPKCESCVFARECVARAKNLQHLLPVKTKVVKLKKRFFYYFVLNHRSRYALKKRQGKDIWNGLYDFYLVERKRPTAIKTLLTEDSFLSDLPLKESLAESSYYKHVLTHQVIQAKFVTITIPETRLPNHQDLSFYSKKAIQNLPKPILINRFLTEANIL